MKLIVFIAMLALAVCGVAQKREVVQTSVMKCTVSGTLNKDITAKKVYLAEMLGRKVQLLDSASVQDNRFTLSMKADGAPAIHYIIAGEDETVLFTDGDDLSFQWNKELQRYVVKGSALNDAYVQMMTEGKDYMHHMEIWAKEYRDASDVRKQEIEKAYDAEQAKLLKIETRYLQENNNLLGLMILEENMYDMAVSQVEQFLEKLPTELKLDGKYQRVARFVANEKKCMPGDDYHDLTLKTPEGKEAKISDYIKSDKYTILDFWASWCGPCRAEMPNMVKIYKEFADKGVEIIGISLDSNEAAWKKAIQDLGITWPQLSDLKGWKSIAAETYGVQAIPMTVVIAPNGRIIKKNLRGEDLYKAAQGWAK